MERRKRLPRLLFLLVFSLVCMEVCGCRRTESAIGNETESDDKADGDNDMDKEPVDGGVTDKTDYSAPKEIASKDISDYHVTFCLEGEWAPGHKNIFYTFDIRPDSAGILTAAEKVTGVAAEADKTLLDSLQDIIDGYHLIAQNGEYRITAGIDPSLFGPCTLTVNYASGEKLTFTHDNDPSEEWAIKTYLAFAKWFADRGNRSLLPDGYEGMVSDIRFKYSDSSDGTSYSYGIGAERDKYGRLMLIRTVNGETEQAPVFSTVIFFDSISSSVRAHDLQTYEASAVSSGEDSSGYDLQLYIAFEDGHHIDIDTGDGNVPEELFVLFDELLDIFNSYFK